MQLPEHVEIVDVAPRDGLQMIVQFVATNEKVRLVEELQGAGVKRIEVTSFVSLARVPQMRDAEEVVRRVREGTRSAGVELMALVVNERGYERARAAEVDWICFVVAPTEEVSRRNAGMSVEESLRQCETVTKRAVKDGVRMRGSIAVSFVCPFEGDVPQERVLAITERMFDAGATEVAFNDTIGQANPRAVYELTARARARWGERQFAGHFHDTHALALANILAAMETGINVFDAAIGGLGGCPFTPGATGNVATERVVWMLHRMRVTTGIDEAKLSACAAQIRRVWK